MKTQTDVRMFPLIAAILLSVQFGSVAAETNGIALKQLVQRCLPGARLVPEAPAKPRMVVAASGDALDLMTALRENPEPRKGAGYWLTPTMKYLGRQRIAVTNTDDAAAVIQLLQGLTRGPAFAKENLYRAGAVEGGWVVEVEHDSVKYPEKVPAMPPYELLVDAGQRVTQVRERCYTFLGNPVIYDQTVRTVYEREVKLNGGVNYEKTLEKELAKEWEKEKAQKAIR
jgi:hypothetical protein